MNGIDKTAEMLTDDPDILNEADPSPEADQKCQKCGGKLRLPVTRRMGCRQCVKKDTRESKERDLESGS